METLNQENDTSSLTEILNSINATENVVKSNIVNYNDDIQNQSNKQENTNDLPIQIPTHILTQQVQLLSNDIDRRIGNYLLDELEKKQKYIDELEDAVKFQEKEIVELKQKIDAFNKLELLSKIKSNMDSKLSEVENNLSSNESTQSKTNKVVHVKKISQPTQPTQQIKNVIEEENHYPRNNPDLVLRRDTGLKVKSIPKEEEEPRYNGIMMLDVPKKKEEEIKIALDYETETNETTDKMDELIKQRRRKARF